MSDDRKDVIVTNQGNSAGALVAGIVAVLVILLVVWYLGFRPGEDSADVNVTIDIPTEEVGDDGSG